MTLLGTFHWFPRAQLELEAGDVTIYRDCWWIINAEGHLCFYTRFGDHMAPQCNPNEYLARKVYDQLKIPESVGIQQVPFVAVPHLHRWWWR